jgi:uncharacterized membrane protein
MFVDFSRNMCDRAICSIVGPVLRPYHLAMDASPQPATRKRTVLAIVYFAVSGIALLFGWGVLESVLFNVVTYEPVDIDVPNTASSRIPLLIALLIFYVPFHKRLYVLDKPALVTSESLRFIHILWPAAAVIAVVWLAFAPSFLIASLLFVSLGAAISRLGPVRRFELIATNDGADSKTDTGNDRYGSLCLQLVLLLILVSTVWHAAMQYSFWKRFMLGYADMGLFVNELEHCLPWRETLERFADTRLGYHAVWMFYLLAPLYALVRHPVFLMVAGPLLLNCAALPFYLTTRRMSGDSLKALLVALSWLLLPSLSRLPYAGTYGFQSIYLAVPFLAWAWCLAMSGRWKASHVCLVLALLCEETVCGVAVGWGVYLVLFTNRRRDGVLIAIGTVIYLLLATQVVIPHFTSAMTYSRLKLFGEVSAQEVVGRLARAEVGYYLVALFAPLTIALWRNAKLLIVIVPTLGLVLLLRDEQYLNIKYWHQSSMLPLIFCAAMLGVVGVGSSDRMERQASSSRGLAWGLFVTVLLFHHSLGYSPLTQSSRLHTAAPLPPEVDPRAQAVAFVYENYPPSQHAILASERLAAHFWKYKAIHELAGIEAFGDKPWPSLAVIDASDGWDPVIAAHRFDEIMSQAQGRGYFVRNRFGPVFVLQVNGQAAVGGAAPL